MESEVRSAGIPHPFGWLSQDGQRRIFLLGLILTIAVMAALNRQGQSLRTDLSPRGIVTFELVGTLEGAEAIRGGWDEAGRINAGLNLGLDYLFMLIYATALSVGSVIASRNWSRFGRSAELAGVLLSWLALIAGLLDAVENYALIRLLLGSTNDLWPIVARWCALPKFGIVAVGLVYIVLGRLVRARA